MPPLWPNRIVTVDISRLECQPHPSPMMAIGEISPGRHYGVAFDAEQANLLFSRIDGIQWLLCVAGGAVIIAPCLADAVRFFTTGRPQ